MDRSSLQTLPCTDTHDMNPVWFNTYLLVRHHRLRPRKTETDDLPPPPLVSMNDHSAVIYLNILHLFSLYLFLFCARHFFLVWCYPHDHLAWEEFCLCQEEVYFPKNISTYKTQKYSKPFYYLNIQNGREMEENIVDINIILYVKPKVRFTYYVYSVIACYPQAVPKLHDAILAASLNGLTKKNQDDILDDCQDLQENNRDDPRVAYTQNFVFKINAHFIF